MTRRVPPHPKYEACSLVVERCARAVSGGRCGTFEREFPLRHSALALVQIQPRLPADSLSDVRLNAREIGLSFNPGAAMQETAYMKDAKAYRAQFAFMCAMSMLFFVVASIGVVLFSYLANAGSSLAMAIALTMNSVSIYFAIEAKDAAQGFFRWTDVIAGQRVMAAIRSQQ